MDWRKRFTEETGTKLTDFGFDQKYIDWFESRDKSQQQRIRELEGALEYAIDRSDNYGEVLYPDVYQKIEQALNKKEQSDGSIIRRGDEAGKNK